jgi:hypothetical protein
MPLQGHLSPQVLIDDRMALLANRGVHSIVKRSFMSSVVPGFQLSRYRVPSSLTGAKGHGSFWTMKIPIKRKIAQIVKKI